MIVMHLSGMGHHRHLERLSQSGYFSCLAYAAYAIGIELNVVESVVLEQIPKAKDCELVLYARDGNAAVAFQLLVTARVVRNNGLLEPAKMERLQKRQN